MIRVKKHIPNAILSTLYLSKPICVSNSESNYTRSHRNVSFKNASKNQSNERQYQKKKNNFTDNIAAKETAMKSTI